MIKKIIKVSASWCHPCKILSERLKDFNKVPIEELDADDNDSMVLYGIKNVPTLLFINDKDEVADKLVGLISIDQINNIINKYE